MGTSIIIKRKSILGSHIVHSYDKDLESITTQLLAMGVLVRKLLTLAETALTTPEENLIEKAKATDKKVNALDAQIEREAITILALRQPMAIDLRFAVSALKIAVILERMGDLAKNSVKRSVKITTPASDIILSSTHQMIEIITEMLNSALEAFQQKDALKAHKVVMRDGEVDAIYRKLMDATQTEMMENPSAIPCSLQYIFAIKNLERIGDYVTKTAKIVDYLVSGERTSKPSKNVLKTKK